MNINNQNNGNNQLNSVRNEFNDRTKENYSWVTQVGLHGQTSEGLEPYKLEYFFFN